MFIVIICELLHTPCRANLRNWRLAESSSCDCGQRQTMNHMVNMCPLTKFKGGLKLLHEVDDDAVIWLESTELRHLQNEKIAYLVHTFLYMHIAQSC